MATNYRGYSHDNIRPTRLMLADLNVGDTLVRADWAFTQYRAELTETVWTVAKTLKSRLVLTRTRDDGRVITVRVLVTNSRTYTGGNGEVEPSIEGDSNNWRRKAFYLFTADDEMLLSIRANITEAQKSYDIRRTATAALEAFKSELTVDNAEAAVLALQNFIASKKENA